MTCPQTQPDPSSTLAVAFGPQQEHVPEERQGQALHDACYVWYEDQMEQCQCGAWVPWDELEMLIGTPRLCRNCRWNHKWAIYEAMKENQTWPLGLS